MLRNASTVSVFKELGKIVVKHKLQKGTMLTQKYHDREFSIFLRGKLFETLKLSQKVESYVRSYRHIDSIDQKIPIIQMSVRCGFRQRLH